MTYGNVFTIAFLIAFGIALIIYSYKSDKIKSPKNLIFASVLCFIAAAIRLLQVIIREM